MTDVDKLVEEIAAMADVPDRRPDQVVAMDMEVAWGMSKTGTEYRLDKLVAEGRMATGMAYDRDRHKTVRVWWKIEEGGDGEEATGSGGGGDGVPGRSGGPKAGRRRRV